MSNKRRLFRELRNTLKLKQDVPNYIPGILGTVINYEQQVSVAGRNGFVYVRVRNSDSEFIEAFNDVVATIYGLPVLLEYKGGYYRVVGRDFGRYATWGSGYSGANLANHGDQHSFGEGSNTGQDVVWVYKRQFMPLLVKPTNPFSRSISVQDDLFMWNSELKHFTGTSIDLTGAWPAPAFSRFVTLYVEPTTITIQGITGSSFPSYNYAPGIEAFIPTVSSLLGIPVGSVRCDGSGTDIQWSNLYDIRTFWAGASHSQGIHISQNSIPLVTGTGIDFGAGFNVVTTGSYVYVSSPDRLAVFDDGVFKVTGTAISFNTGLSVVVTGSVAFVNNTLDTFLELTDTPDSYTSQANKYVRVNGAETALEFVTGANVSSFLHLLDTPKSYSGQANKFVAVNSGETALVFTSGSGGGSSGSTFNDPVSIGDCKIWLKADSIDDISSGDLLKIWKDSSGWGNHAVPVGQNTRYYTNQLNGQPIVYLTGTSSYLNLPGFHYNQRFTAFIVFMAESFPADYNVFYGFCRWGSDEGGIFIKSNGKSAEFLGAADSAGFFSYDGTGALTYSTGTWYLFESLHGNDYYHTYANAAYDKTGTASGYHVAGFYGTSIGFYQAGSAAGRMLRGRVAEVILYNKELTSAQVSLVRTYLNNKYAIY